MTRYHDLAADLASRCARALCSVMLGGVVLGGVMLGGPVWAQQGPTSAPSGGPGIYTCVDDQGRRHTADRPIAACTQKEQRVLNRDGSLKAVLPPALSPEEVARRDARERAAEEARAVRAEAIRRDRFLMSRFPDQAAHDRARHASLETIRVAMRASESRLEALSQERKPLLEEAEFYAGKTLPASLKSRLDAIDAAATAQRNAMRTQDAEVDRINKLYDAELARLLQLWGGAAPGSSPSVAAAQERSGQARE